MSLETRTVTDTMAVAPQIEPTDIAALAAAGFKAVICNRPDGEEPGQPTVADIKAETEAAGLTFTHIPITQGDITFEKLDTFAQVLTETDGPVFAYCRSGTRSCMLWGMVQARMGNLSVPEILSLSQGAGYDFRGQAPILNQLAEGG